MCIYVSDDTTDGVYVQPNLYGLHDMYGNVGEWTHDRWGKTTAGPATDPVGPRTGTDRVIRGCAYDSSRGTCRWSTQRGKGSASARDQAVGFRPARSLPPSGTP